MKPIPKFLFHLMLALMVAGLLALAGYGAKFASKRYWNRLSFVQTESWNHILLARKQDITGHTWMDMRPLNILAGDSHIEMCNWYDAFHGAISIRNCGLSSSRIEHVAELIATVRDRQIDSLLLHCGINNLGRGDSPAACLEQYRKLLDHAALLRPRRIIVIAVMPVRQSPLDARSQALNNEVSKFNGLLDELCRERGVTFADLKEDVVGSSGGLKEEFTHDGLHLNSRGYAAITPRILSILSP